MEKRSRQIPARRFRRTRKKPRSAAFLTLVFVLRLVVASFFVVLEIATAQTPNPPTPANFDATPTNPNEKTTFWLADSNGSWNIPLPNWTLEEVMKTIDAREEKTAESSFSIQRVDVFGAAKDGLARLTIKVDVNVADGLVRVPLGLREGVYIPDPRRADDGQTSGFSFEGPGLCALDVDPKTGEYVAVVQTAPRRPRRRVPRPDIEPARDASGESISNENVPNENAPNENVPNENVPNENVPNENVPNENVPNENAPNAFFAKPNERYADDANDALGDDFVDGRDRLNATRVRPNSYSLTLELCFVVETLGTDEHRLRVSFPVSVHSQMTLEAPIADAKLDVVKGAVAAAPTSLSETTTELRFHGLGRGGETTEISWRKDASQRFESRVVYQVEDALIAVGLGVRETTFEATLPIRAFGGESDVFLVRLPERASLVVDSVIASGPNDEAFEIRGVREIDVASDGALPGAATPAVNKKVEIRLAEKTATASLKLKATVPVAENESANASSAGSTTPIPARKISGFTVDGAQKQYGRVQIEKAEELDFNITPVYGIRAGSDRSPRLDETEEIYSFFAQPFALEAQAFVRQDVVNVKPEYQAIVFENDARLRARFQYSIHGSKVNELRIRLNGWNFAGPTDDSVVDVPRIYRNETTDETIFPLKTPTEGVVEFELTAARPLDAVDGEFVLPLPTPVADWVEPAPCVVVPTDAVELTPLPKRAVGLSPKSTRLFSFDLELPKSQQPPLAYQTAQRFAGRDESPTTFAARVEKHEQKIEIEAKTDVRVSEQGAKQIRQTFVYRVEREPLEAVSILTPLKLLETSGDRQTTNMKIFVDDKLVPPQNLQLETNDLKDDKVAVRRVLLSDSPKIGTFVVSVQYDAGTVDLKPGMTSKIELNLTQPGDETLLSNELTIAAPLGVSLDYVQNDARFWTLEESERSTDGRSSTFRYRSTTREFLATFNGSLGANDNFGVAIVDRAWIQSWVSDDSRLDRIAYRISTDRDRLELRLPNGVRSERVAVSINQTRLANAPENGRGLFAEDGTLVVPVSEERRGREFVLEIAYSLDRAPGSPNRWAFEFPEFSGDSTWIRRAYWQLITPSSRCVVVDPANWTPDYVVERGRFGFFRRVASLDQSALCDWIGIPDREAIPSEVNVYLFSGFNQPNRSRLYVVDRALLALLGGGATLAFGLGLIYFPFVRSRGVLFVAAATVATLVAFRPLLALIFLQTTIIGVALTLATALVALFFGRKDARARSSAAKIVRSAVASDAAEQRAFGDGERKKRSGGSSRVLVEK